MIEDIIQKEKLFFFIHLGKGIVNGLFNITDDTMGLNTKIYILDTRNYTWVTSFVLTTPTTNSTQTTPINGTQTAPDSTNPSSDTRKWTTLVVVFTVISAVIIIAASILGFIFYKKYKKDDVIHIPGSR